MNKTRQITGFSMLFIVLIILDQIFKHMVVTGIEFGSRIVVIENFFSLQYVRNTGSAFSFLADQSWGIYVLSGISIVLGTAIFAIMVMSCGKGFKYMTCALCLLSAGAYGNLIDRVRLHYVVDFLRFDFGPYTFPIFNFADICAVVGTFMIIGAGLFASKYFDRFLESFKAGEAHDEPEV